MTKIPDSPEHHEAIKELTKQDDAYKDALVNEAKTFGEYQKLLAESRNKTLLSDYVSENYSDRVMTLFAKYTQALQFSINCRYDLLAAADDENSYHNLQESVNTEVND